MPLTIGVAIADSAYVVGANQLLGRECTEYEMEWGAAGVASPAGPVSFPSKPHREQWQHLMPIRTASRKV